MFFLPHLLFPTHLGRARIRTQSLLVAVFVFTISTTQSIDLRNVAIGKPALMDSLYEADNNVAASAHCVDGESTKYNMWQYSCCHSGETQEFPKWWIVDLLREYDIREVWVTNRDSFGGRLRNFTIDIFKEYPNDMPGFPNILGQVCAFQPPDASFPPASSTKAYTCDQPITGRYLRVVKYGYFALVMCEVQVMAPAFTKQYYATRHPDMKANSLPYQTLSTTKSYVHCATLCAQDEQCNSFSWKQALLECGLYKLSPFMSPAFSFVAEPGTDFTLNFDINFSG